MFTFSLPKSISVKTLLFLPEIIVAGPAIPEDGGQLNEKLNGLVVVHKVLRAGGVARSEIRRSRSVARKKSKARNLTRRHDSTPADSGDVQRIRPWTQWLSTELLFGPRTCASDRTPPHRERTKNILEAATPPDLQAPPAGHREHRPRLTVSLPANPHRTAV